MAKGLSNGQRWFVLACLIMGLVGGSIIAQQQQSGGNGGGPVTQSGTWVVQPGNTPNTVAWKVDGSAVTQPISGTTTSNQGGTWTVQPGNTPNTTAWKVDGSAVTQPVSGTVTINPLPTGSNVIGKEVPVTGCGTTVFSQALVAVPTSLTVVTATTTCPYTITISNTNASPQTITITDNQGSPVTAVGPGYSIPGLSQVSFPFNGVQFTTGIKWQAGGTGVTGAILGVQ